MNAHIYIAFSTQGRFIRLPSTINKELLEFKNKIQETEFNNKIQETMEMDTVKKSKKELELFNLFQKNNGRHIDFRYVNCILKYIEIIYITKGSLGMG